jgi:hypothetical protein
MKFKITFGQKYRREPHPTLGYWPELVDGWLTVEAEDEMAARDQIASLIGPAYAFLYEETDYLQYNTAGCLGTLEDAVAEPRDTSWCVGVSVTLNADGSLELNLEDAVGALSDEGAPYSLVAALDERLTYEEPVVTWARRH